MISKSFWSKFWRMHHESRNQIIGFSIHSWGNRKMGFIKVPTKLKYESSQDKKLVRIRVKTKGFDRDPYLPVVCKNYLIHSLERQFHCLELHNKCVLKCFVVQNKECACFKCSDEALVLTRTSLQISRSSHSTFSRYSLAICCLRSAEPSVFCSMEEMTRHDDRRAPTTFL